ncbi:MAG: ATP-binding protein [Bacteroidales bacterium]
MLSFDHSIRKKNLEVFINSDDVEFNKLYGDCFKIKQVLVNIVSNAIKFTDEGSIDITLKTIAQNGNIMAHFIIEDTGIGIDQNEIDKIFDEFKQLDNYLIKKIKGTGLGLAIAKQLIVLLNGSIHEEVNLKRGAYSILKFHW